MGGIPLNKLKKIILIVAIVVVLFVGTVLIHNIIHTPKGGWIPNEEADIAVTIAYSNPQAIDKTDYPIDRFKAKYNKVFRYWRVYVAPPDKDIMGGDVELFIKKYTGKVIMMKRYQ